MRRTAAILSKRFTSSGSQKIVASVTSQAQSQSRCFSALPDSVSRVGVSTVFPNEYPGHDYKFNWQLNADGVTPLKKSAFRITKPLDLKIAGLSQPKTMPLKVSLHAIIILIYCSVQGIFLSNNAHGLNNNINVFIR